MMCRSNLLRCLWGIVALFAGCSDDRIDELARQLTNEDMATRRAAAMALKEFPGDRERAIPALVDAAKSDEDMQVRKLSVQALGTIGVPARAKIHDLTPILESEEKSLRVAVALAIARIEPTNEAGRDELIKAIQAGNGGVLLEIGRLGPCAEWAVPTLTELLSRELIQIRSLAAHTLGEIGPAAADAEPSLERMSQDRDGAVRAVALDALKKVRGESTKR